MIVIPLECNRNIPYINFKSNLNVTMVVNAWLFIHFVYLNINYCHYKSITVFYRLFCNVWMLLYCYPVQTHRHYHWFKQRLPNWIRPFLRFVRDNKLVIKVWRNFRAVIERRTREENVTNDNRSCFNSSSGDTNSYCDREEKFEVSPPIKCTDREILNELL